MKTFKQTKINNTIRLKNFLVMLAIGTSASLQAQDVTGSEKMADKDQACSTAAVIEQAQKGGACAVEKGENYTKITASGRIVALLPEKMQNNTRCLEVLQAITERCAPAGEPAAGKNIDKPPKNEVDEAETLQD